MSILVRRRSVRVLGLLFIASLLFFAAGRAQVATLVVNTAADHEDGSCDPLPRTCTLREAVNTANAIPGVHNIIFEIPGAGVHRIAPTTSLPIITEAVIIDGYTQPGASENTLAVGNDAVLLIEISGVAAGPNFPLRVTGGNSTIRGLVINGFTNAAAIDLRSDNNVIEGNFLGTNTAGDTAFENFSGVTITDGTNNTIGGTTPAARNVISGNRINGITLSAGTNMVGNNVIAGNYIGINAAGTAALGNNRGVDLNSNLSGNTVGGTTAAARNVISGNGTGVVIFTDNNTIQGNYIGLNATGTGAVGNTGTGLFLQSTSGNLIGGLTTTPGQAPGNVISGNATGIDSNGNDTPGNTYQGNIIGLNAAGNAVVANNGTGIEISNAGGENLIGGTAADARNIISGNANHGILLSNDGNAVQGNFIGTGLNSVTAFGNGQNGIFINSRINNNIGGVMAGAGNVIAHNTDHGVRVTFFAAGAQNPIRGNSIFNNGRIGIDLAGGTEDANAVTANDANDADAGANNLQNYPVLTQATSAGGSTDIVGALNSTPNTTFNIDFYLSSAAAADPSGFGEGESHYGTTNVTTDTTGNAEIFFNRATTTSGVLTATATDPNGNTSEFSRIITVRSTLVVNSTLDTDNGVCTTAPDGCTLREAINAANANAGADTISFNIPGAGVRTITPTSALPVITDSATIDAYTQPGASANTLAVGSDAVLLIEISGVNAGNVPGISITAANSAVRGLIVNNFTGNGIEVLPASVGGNRVEGNFVGINSTGTAAAGNAIGIALYGSNNIAGGTTPAARNVVGGNRINGIGVGLPTGVTNPIPTGNVIQGNYVGTNAAGTIAIPNSAPGIAIAQGTTNNTIGGTDPGAGNLVSGNGANGGIAIFGNSANNVVQGNRIGTNAAGTAAISNHVSGVLLANAANNNTIGGTTAAAANIIAGNDGTGVLIAGAGTDSNLVRGNIIGLNIAGVALGNGAFAPGVRIEAGAKNNVIGGTVAGARNIVSGNGGAGVLITDGGTTGNLVQGNFIGTNAAGTATTANARGVIIDNGATNNTVGGTSAAARNILAGNEYGVLIDGAGTSNNSVQANFIGTNAAGTVALPNRFGVGLTGGANSNTIGGTSVASRNIISGNTDANVFSDGGRSNVVLGNHIGTNVAGTAALDATRTTTAGVWLTNNSADNIIGGTNAAARNIISGNAGAGILIQGTDGSPVTPTANNFVRGNFIGTNATGTAAVVNGAGGIHLTANTSGNVIGGTTAGARNVISGNSSSGIRLENANGNTIQGNFIGVAADGTTALGNIGANADGITIDNGSSNNTIGGTVAGARNIIANNSARGILLTSVAGAGNGIRQNSIFNNGNLGIDLGTDGVTANDANDADVGPNNRQNYPVINNVTAATISGTLQSTPGIAFTLDFFSNAAADPTGFGEGETYLGSVDVTTDATGDVTFNFNPVGGIAASQFVTVTATDAANNTSEFSRAQTVTAGGGVCVNAPAGAIAWYPAENDANDIIGGHNGTPTPDAGHVPAKVGNGFQVGEGSIRVPDAAALQPANITAEAWVRATAPGTFQYILAKSLTGGGASYAFYTGPSGGLFFYVTTEDPGSGGAGLGDAWLSPDAGTGIWDGNLHHIAGTFDGNSVRLYVDGVQIGAGTPTTGSIQYSNGFQNGDLIIGNFFPNGAPSWPGVIDEMTLYNRALAVSEIQDIFDADSAGKCRPGGPLLPNLSINDVTVAEGNDGTTNAVFTVTLSAASVAAVTVDFATADGTATAPADYTATNGTLTFAPGVLTQTISMPIIGDTDIEPNETFFVNLINATNATIADNQGLGTITNDDGVVRPPNDDFVNAQQVSGVAGSLLGFNTNATRETGEPLHAGVNGNTSVWYRWRPSSFGTARFESSGLGFPSLIGIYRGQSVDALSTLAGQSSQSDDNGFLTAIAEFQADPDIEYFIAVDGVGGAQNTFALRWTLIPTSAPTPTPTTAPQRFSLGGRIATGFGFGLQGLQVNLSGNGQDTTMTTASNGEYSFGGLPAGTYTITPIFSGLRFSPSSRTLTVGPSYRRVDFFAYTGAAPAPPPAPEPVGAITPPPPVATPRPTATATPRPIATATPRPTATARPTASPTVSPTATVRPTATTRPTSSPTTSPTQRYRVSGRIATSSGFGLRGITVYLMDASGTLQAVQTDAAGGYEFVGVALGQYTVEPAYRSLMFLPSSRDVQVTNGNQAGVDFIARLQ